MQPELIVERFRRGEQNAIVELIDLFYPRVYAFLRRLTRNEADAADLTQRTFGRIWQALSGFSGRSSVGSWIHSIAYHTYVDWRRANHRMESRSPEWWEERVTAEPKPDDLAAGRDLAATVYAMVDKLGSEQRETVHLHYYQELTLEETADAMNVAVSTVKYRLRQALLELERNINSEPVKTGERTATKRV
jgi:RNA polymerase sigma-70 factor (ECF subfamily)